MPRAILLSRCPGVKERQQQSLDYRTARQILPEPVDMWTIGVADRRASTASRGSSERGEMLTFAHIASGTPPRRFDGDKANGKLVKPAAVPTAIGADIETGRVTP
jgi:hypothetical protein